MNRNNIKLYLLIFGVIAILLIIYLSAFFYSISKVEVVNVHINKLNEFSTTGFNVEGNVEIYNGGIIPVRINKVEYSVVLEDSGAMLSTGNIEGNRIGPNKVESFGFSSDVAWTPTAEIALGMITRGQTYCKVSGIASIDRLIFGDIQMPFETRFDIEPYVRQFIRQKVDEAIEAVTDTFARVTRGIAGLFT